MFNLFQRNTAISTKDLAEKLKEPITLLDVRTPEEYRGGHITKASNYPLNKIDRYQGKEKEAVKILKQKGYEAINVQGGMNRWQGPTRGGK